MLKVNIYRDKRNRICSFKAFGHCGFDEWGKDIVCAATSALLQIAILSINEYCKIKPDIEISAGKLACLLPTVKDPLTRRDIKTILETMLIGLKKIQEQFPGNIKITEAGAFEFYGSE